MSLTTLFLQIDSLQAVSAVAPEEKISLFKLLQAGGVLMIPLLICSLLMCYVFIERLLTIRKAAPDDTQFINRVREQVAEGNLKGAKALCRNTATPEARMVEKGISRIGKPIDQIERSMEAIGKLEIYQLEKNLSILSTIASIAPMLGFLGTLSGMLILFFDIQHKGFDLNSIAGGIYTKLITAAVGLIVGLLSYIGYKYLNAQINRAANRMELAASEFLDILQEPAK